MDHTRLHDILTRITTVLGHMTALPAGAAMASSVAKIREDVAALAGDSVDLVSRVAALEHSIADLHAALSDKPSPPAVQKAVADVEVPQA